MRYAGKFLLTIICLCASWVAVQAGASERRISCSSIDSRYNFCRARITGPVYLVTQQSSAACIEGRTWGFNRDGIWVDRGCRGVFAIGGNGMGSPPGWGPPPGPGRRGDTIVCGSVSNGFNYCPAHIRGPVRLIRQHSARSCIEGRTWGYDRGGIWVDRGCRGEFEIGRPGGRPDSPPPFWPPPPPPGWQPR